MSNHLRCTQLWVREEPSFWLGLQVTVFVLPCQQATSKLVNGCTSIDNGKEMQERAICMGYERRVQVNEPLTAL